MADPAQFVKAEIEIEGRGSPIPVYFNPTEYSISKSNEWKYDKVTGNSFPKAQFGGGNPRELTLSLLLDASLLSKTAHIRDVTNDLFKMMEVKEGQTPGDAGAVPPFVTFKWGRETTFKSVCTQLTVAFKLFRPNGDPIRADVKMTLKQAETAGTASANGANRAGNPTTRANAGHGVHTVKDGDTLPSIAYEAYGDATVWRAIADVNRIENPLHLRRGTALSLPKLDG
jgi:Contractile injection system tube protein/LysM domain